MMIRTNAAANRKDLVKAMSDLLNEKPRYCFAPSFAYISVFVCRESLLFLKER